MSEYQLSAIGQIWWALLVPLGTGVAYFWAARGTAIKRLLLASHSIVLLIAFAYAVIISSWSNIENWRIYLWPFVAMQGVFVATSIYSGIRLNGSTAVHALQLLQVPSAVLLYFVGGMTITHDWL